MSRVSFRCIDTRALEDRIDPTMMTVSSRQCRAARNSSLSKRYDFHGSDHELISAYPGAETNSAAAPKENSKQRQADVLWTVELTGAFDLPLGAAAISRRKLSVYSQRKWNARFEPVGENEIGRAHETTVAPAAGDRTHRGGNWKIGDTAV